MNRAILISGFPGIGKSFVFDNSSLNISDSDSSKFPKENFPSNYMEHIKSIIDDKDIILISSHDIVRQALVDNGLPFILVYPDRSLKQEYIERFEKRGSPAEFISFLEKNWDMFIDQMEQQDNCKKVVLNSGEYLKDYIGTVMEEKHNKVEEIKEVIDGDDYTLTKTHLTTLKKDTTSRGFGLWTFKDKYGAECSLQDSSLANESAIWFGIDNADPKIMASKTAAGGVGWVPYEIPDDVHLTTRMHLTQEQVKALLPILQYFAETGEYVRDFNGEESC
jgi:hypothetical protein